MALPADDEIRAIAREILARAEYARWHQEEAAASWVEWLVREMVALQRWFADLAARSPVLFAALLGALALLAAGLFLHVAWTIRQSLRAEPDAAPGTPALRPPAETAARLAAGGRFLDAARLMQAAVLEHLVSRRLVALSPAESNAVLTARLAAAPLPGDLGGRAVALVRGLERRWFRDRLEDEALYEAWVRLHGDLVADIG
jgi:hypothetical protein